ncbi:hypothetical protein J0J30_24000, partial [Vibrio vulnificus]|nr:hypothetical protein [Vibrio vulnificus]
MINYEIVLKSRRGRQKPKEMNFAMKANSSSLEDSDVEFQKEEEEDEKMALYAKNLRKFKNLRNSRRRE